MTSAAPAERASELRRVGRYVLLDEIGVGGMASVYLGRLVGPVGFARTVAIKRMHPQAAKDPRFAAMFVDEARLAARIHHPNVISTLDVVDEHGELFVVMDFVFGEPLSRLLSSARCRGERMPPTIAASIVAGVLHGLHAAHDTRGDGGEPLQIVHRDVSPQNVLVGADGISRVLDFGVAKARGRLSTTRDGELKGKLRYMSPEQVLRGSEVDRRSDVFAVGVVLFEALTGRRLFDGTNEAETLRMVLNVEVSTASEFFPELASFDGVLSRALAADPEQRFPTA